ADDLVEGVVVRQVEVVLEADEALGIPDQLVRQREPDGPVEGIEDEPPDEDEEGEEEEEGGGRGAAARAPPRGGARPAGAGERVLMDGHVPPAGCRRRP